MRILITFISLIFLSCSYVDNNYKTNQYTFLDTIQTSNIDTNQNKNPAACSLTFHVEFDSTKTLMENLYSGWTDTFSINKQAFRLRFDTASKDIENSCIEQLKNGQWQKLFNLYLNNDEYEKDDINKDGFTDFVKFYHARDYMYFYNPITKTITDTFWVMPDENSVIDKENFIMYNYYEAMYGNLYESSQLYTYRNRQPYFFYELLLITNDSTNIKKMNLYKYKNGNYGDTVFIKTIATGHNLEFDYENYWTRHYKELMAIQH